MWIAINGSSGNVNDVNFLKFLKTVRFDCVPVGMKKCLRRLKQYQRTNT